MYQPVFRSFTSAAVDNEAKWSGAFALVTALPDDYFCIVDNWYGLKNPTVFLHRNIQEKPSSD